MIDTTDVDSDGSDDDNDVPSVEEREERKSLQVLDVQSFVDLTCEKNKAKRELDVQTSGISSSSSSSNFVGKPSMKVGVSSSGRSTGGFSKWNS